MPEGHGACPFDDYGITAPHSCPHSGRSAKMLVALSLALPCLSMIANRRNSSHCNPSKFTTAAVSVRYWLQVLTQTPSWEDRLRFSLIHSVKKHLLSDHSVPDSVVNAGNTPQTKIGTSLVELMVSCEKIENT